MAMSSQLWQRCLFVENDGLVELETPDEKYNLFDGVRISRNAENFHDVSEYCVHWGSYLAKKYSKAGLPPYVNGFECSRLNMSSSCQSNPPHCQPRFSEKLLSTRSVSTIFQGLADTVSNPVCMFPDAVLRTMLAPTCIHHLPAQGIMGTVEIEFSGLPSTNFLLTAK